MKSESKPGTFDRADIVKSVRTAVLIGLAAAVGSLAQDIPDLEWGPAGPFVVPVVGALLDLVRRWIRDNQEADA